LNSPRGLSLFPTNSGSKPNAVIVSGIDFPIVEKKPVGEVPEAAPRLRIVLNNGFFRKISAGHDKGTPDLPQKKVMKRCIRKHDSQITISRGYFPDDR
jgi:hypothetical protein